MSGFKAIETQEELDRIIQERLNRKKESTEKQYSDYDEIKTRNADLEKQIGTLQSTIEELKTSTADYEKQLSELNTTVAGYETANLRTRIALQSGLPYDLAGRLVGTDEESIKADAERLSAFVVKQQTPAPLRNTEQNLGSGKDRAYKSLLENLNTEGE
ncbi:DUF4355 domain-containing protein [Enterococcus sp. BWM-S5]|uniref:DUF4355 domain-containing protein n=1 Tax=Enterococcus larvae TaxID=2794352 RepID=A0ABS4CIF9_9ENTE|nr:DUF4355 domain-containing protein [Enterococcus larvae]MBP1046410.1 DUF4355 domain-containing protein [Enterococcus larvae]